MYFLSNNFNNNIKEILTAVIKRKTEIFPREVLWEFQFRTHKLSTFLSFTWPLVLDLVPNTQRSLYIYSWQVATPSTLSSL